MKGFPAWELSGGTCATAVAEVRTSAPRRTQGDSQAASTWTVRVGRDGRHGGAWGVPWARAVLRRPRLEAQQHVTQLYPIAVLQFYRVCYRGVVDEGVFRRRAVVDQGVAVALA